MTDSSPLPWTLDRLVPRLYSGDGPGQPLTAQVSLHAEPVTGSWGIGLGLRPRFVPFEGKEAEEAAKAGPDDRVYRMELAPGGRYRLELITGEDPALSGDPQDGDTGDAEEDDDDPWASAVATPAGTAPDDSGTWRGYCSDGTTHWTVQGDVALRSGEPALPVPVLALLRPAWLVSGHDLTLDSTGQAEATITATPRPLTRGRYAGRNLGLDFLRVVAAPGTGLLLRYEAVRRGRTDEVAAITGLELLPADPPAARFSPPPGMRVTDLLRDDEPGAGPSSPLDGPGWRLAKNAAGALGEGLGFAIRHTPRTPPPDGTPPMPDCGSPDHEPAPLPADLVNLLHGTGRPAPRFTATASTWWDGEALIKAGADLRARTGPPLASLLGPEDVWAALTDRPPSDRYQAERITISLPGRYRIDRIVPDGGKQPLTVASDGDERWSRYENRIVVLPAAARPLEERWLRLADPSWLLAPGWLLSAPEGQEIGGRAGWRLWGRFSGAEAGAWRLAGEGLLTEVCAVVDAEYGVLLRLALCTDGQPAICTDLAGLSLPSGAYDREQFAVPDPADVPVVHGKTALDEFVPPPVQAVVGAARAGATFLSGLLSRPPRPGGPGEDRGG
jgi:hypothetical protein